MKKRSLLGKILGQEDDSYVSQNLSIERRPPSAPLDVQPRRDVQALHSKPSLEEREDLAGIMKNLPPATSAKLAELNRAKSDLAQMQDELSRSQRLYKQATERMDELSRYLSHSEVDLSALERLQPENERLSAQINTLKSELTREKALTSEAEARATAIESKYIEAQKANEEYRQDALTLTENIRSLKQSIDAKNREISDLQAKLDDALDALEQEKDSSSILADKNARLVAEMSTMSRTNLELEKRVEEIHTSNKRNAQERESAQLELKSLRLEYTTLRDVMIEKSAKLEALQNELIIKERNFDESLKYRENEVFGLQTTVEDYKVQLRIKEEVSRSADRELIDLKTMMAEETKRRRRLEKELEEQTKQLEQNRQALLQARNNFDDLNRRLVDAQSELRAVKVVNQQQAIKLEQYSAVGGVVVDFKREADEISRKRESARAQTEAPTADPTDDVRKSG